MALSLDLGYNKGGIHAAASQRTRIQVVRAQRCQVNSRFEKLHAKYICRKFMMSSGCLQDR
eukprot:4668040-Pleurochrysis_carterae.AAC.1